MITLEQAKALTHGNILYHVSNRNADGTPQRWRINGKVKTWKRTPSRIEVPVKHGFRGFDCLTEDGLNMVCLTEEEAKGGEAVIDIEAVERKVRAAAESVKRKQVLADQKVLAKNLSKQSLKK